MSRPLLVKFKQYAHEEPFLILYQEWGAYTAEASDVVQEIIEIIEEYKVNISTIYGSKPNSRYQLADFLIKLMHERHENWFPECHTEVESSSYGISREYDRKSYIQMTRLFMIAYGMYESADMIDDDISWDPEGILVPLDDSIRTYQEMESDDGCYTVEIRLCPDGTTWITFRVMNVFEMDEKEVKSTSPDVFKTANPLKRYCEEMSVVAWGTFHELIMKAERLGTAGMYNKKESIVLEFV